MQKRLKWIANSKKLIMDINGRIYIHHEKTVIVLKYGFYKFTGYRYKNDFQRQIKSVSSVCTITAASQCKQTMVYMKYQGKL